MTKSEAIKQLDWHFNEDDGISADDKTHAAYATLRIIAADYRHEETSLSICPSCDRWVTTDYEEANV